MMPPLTPEEAEPIIYSNAYIAYYDSKGQLISDKGIGSQKHALLTDCSYLIHKISYEFQNNYLSCSRLRDKNAQGAVYVVYYIDRVAIYNEIFYPLINIVIIIFIIVFIVNIVLLDTSVKKIRKQYRGYMDKNRQLVSDISHEFNTPLAVINAKLSSVLSQPKSSVSQVAENISVAVSEVNRLKRMVKDMLSLSKSEQGQLKIESETFDISKMLESLAEPFQIMCELEEKTMDISIQPDIKVFTDKDKITQLVLILLDNAQKYTSKGESIFVGLKKKGEKIFITIADTGIGVEPDKLDKIFERFYRVDNSRTNDKEIGGNGLGLAIAKTIAFNLNGKLIASQNLPKGLKIEFEFPNGM